MLSEPLLAHPPEISGVHAAWHPPADEDDRDQHYGETDDQKHNGSRRGQISSA